MSEKLIKPYEISVWEETLEKVENSEEYKFVEKKLAVIGSNTMTGLNKVYDPVFNKKSNGERTLTFSLKYKYYDPYTEEEVTNPFVNLLVNERKVKLHYEDEWYEFIVKDHTESSDEYSWEYSCSDAFVLELSKTGYNITFDAELNNNQGTAEYLATETLKNTDWRIGEANVGRQYVEEPIYNAILSNNVRVLNTDTGEESVLFSNTEIYLFYSYVKNKDGKNIQFIIQDPNGIYQVDSKNVITDTNFRVKEELFYDERELNGILVKGFWRAIEGGDENVISIGSVEIQYKANRLAYNQLTTYDPVMQRTVDIFKIDDREVYRYIDYTYTTSNVLVNYFANGENFNILEDGSLQGWNPYTDQETIYTAIANPTGNPSEKGWYVYVNNEYVLTQDTEVQSGTTYYKKEAEKVNKLELVTRPELGTDKKLVDINKLSQIEGFLKIRFNGRRKLNENGQILNTVYNKGIESNASLIESISAGQEFVFRWRGAELGQDGQGETIEDLESLVPYNGIRAIVATYDQDDPTPYGYYYKHLKENDIIIEFDGEGEQFTPKELDNYVRGGSLTPINYVATTDEEINPKKIYYTKSGEGTEESPYKYSKVDEPKVGELGSYYEVIVNTQDTYEYVIDDVVQTPSTKYIYVNEADGKEYVWNGIEGKFEIKDSDNYLPYWYITAKAKKGVPNSYLKDPKKKIGIFIYVNEDRLREEVLERTFNVPTENTDETEDTQETTVEPTTHTQVEIAPVTNGTITVKYTPIGEEELTFTFTEGESKEYTSVPDEEELSDENEPVDEDESTEEDTSEETISEGYTITYDAFESTIDISDTRGIVNYTISYNAKTPVFIQDIQLTKFIPDADTPTQPVTLGNVPTAESTPTSYYYLKPLDGVTAEEIQTYTSPEALIQDIGSQGSLTAIYNENSEKILSISASQSNCFNILQTIAETFECWVELDVEHDPETGYIVYDENNLPKKYVNLKEYVGHDNSAGFKYGINLQSIERNINSDEIVTKLIVDQSQSDYTDEGYVSIALAPSNPTGESYILNFDYYYSQGLLNRDEVEADINNFTNAVAAKNVELQAKEKERRDLEASLTALGSKRNVFTELVESAKDGKTEALGDFENLTGKTYEDYTAEHESLVDDDRLTEEDTIVDVLGQLYVNSAAINNYSGILTNVDQEYWNVRKKLRGTENYSCKLWTASDATTGRHVYVELNDFLVGFKFTIGESISDESTVSKKFFDKTTNDTTISFEAPSGYHLKSAPTEIVEDRVISFEILADEQIDGVEDEVKKRQEEKDEIIKKFSNKYGRYIQEGTWSSNEYIDSELYYLDAMQVSNTSAQPVVSYTINVVEISQLEGLEWYKFDAGDKTYVEDTEFFGWYEKSGVWTPVKEEVIVSEVEWHLEEPDKNTITVQNYKTRFEDLFQRISATVQTVQYNEATYAKITSLMDADGTINKDVLIDSLNTARGTYNLTSDGSVAINGDEILIHNLTNPENYVKIYTGGVQVSSDSGNTWIPVIDGQGIYVDAVHTGTLNTDNVIIGNKNAPSFRWDRSGISAYGSSTDQSGNTVYNLNTYVRYDEYGLYGIKDNSTFKAQSLDDILDKAHFAVTWDGFFIKNSYEGGGRVEITSDNDFRVLNTVNEQENEKIKIGALEWMIPTTDIEIDNNKTYYKNEGGRYVVVSTPVAAELNLYYEKTTEPQNDVAPSLYGIRIKNNDGVEVMKTDDNGDLTIIGTIEATAANFSQKMTVGKNDSQVSNWITIDGRYSDIHSSDYFVDEDAQTRVETGRGWIINKDGDAVFNNITARGAIKTAVFEYAEIQAVGGIFIFRPSSTIRSVELGPEKQDPEEARDLILTVEKPQLFKVGQWCKVSNYYNGNNNPDVVDPQTQTILQNNGLAHVYEITNITTTGGKTFITLEGAAAMVESESAIVEFIDDLIGGALVDMGKEDGTSNYGIGINSSDNTIDLPARAISLFKTTIDKTEEQKVNYNYQGILGTLPPISSNVDSTIYNKMVNTQGIYTNNMYIGDQNNYIAFYTDNNSKKLTIKTNEFTVNAGQFLQNGYLYLSTNNLGQTISNLSGDSRTNWRQVIGTKFAIDSDGNLFANSANINGEITATSLTIGAGAPINDETGELQNGLRYDHDYEMITVTISETTYELTTDTEIDPNKEYYVEINNGEYGKVLTPNVESIDTYYEKIVTTTTKEAAEFTAHLYRGDKEVTADYSADNFLWYIKDEKGERPFVPKSWDPQPDPLNSGKVIRVYTEDCEYGVEVVGKYIEETDANALTTNSAQLLTASNEPLTIRASGEEVRVRDLQTSTTLYDTDKIMIVGDSDEHLVTVSTLYNRLKTDAESDEFILYCGSATDLVG